MRLNATEVAAAPWWTMEDMDIKELATQSAVLTPTEAKRVAGQLRGVLDGLPPDHTSYTDTRLRHGLEVFLAGYSLGAR